MKANTNTVIVSLDASQAITSGVKVNEKGSKQWVIASDLLRTEGVTPDMLSGKTKVADIADAVRAAIVLGFTARERKLLAGDPKTMSDTDKAERKTAQQKIGVYIALIQKYLRGEKEKGETKSVAERLKVMLESCAKLTQSDEEPTGYDPVEMGKAINLALKSIK